MKVSYLLKKSRDFLIPEARKLSGFMAQDLLFAVSDFKVWAALDIKGYFSFGIHTAITI